MLIQYISCKFILVSVASWIWEATEQASIISDGNEEAGLRVQCSLRGHASSSVLASLSFCIEKGAAVYNLS